MNAVSVLVLALGAVALARPSHLSHFKNLVTFGDSYTDTVTIFDGGVPWPVYAAGYAGLNLFPFAKSGATCSNKLTPRDAPSLMESQVPAFKDAQLRLRPEETVYTLWIGTNDLGMSQLVTGSDVGVSVVDTTECAVEWIRVMHSLGARNFIFQNMIPLQLTPLYSATGIPNQYWSLPRNATEWANVMTELTLSGNALSKLMLRDLAPQLRDTHIALFDSHSLFADIHAHPEQYLNGTAPLNVTGSLNGCPFEVNGGPIGGACPVATADRSVRDSFLWWDELHPSEQTDRIVAREISKALKGNTRWATWIS